MNYYQHTLTLTLTPSPPLPIGERDANELKEHPFFHEMDWEGLANGRIMPPWYDHIIILIPFVSLLFALHPFPFSIIFHVFLSCPVLFCPVLCLYSSRSPTVVGSLDTSQFDMEFTSMMPVVSPDVRDAYFGSLDRAFVGFTFIDDSAMGPSHKNNFGTSVRSGPGATLMATSFGGAGRR